MSSDFSQENKFFNRFHLNRTGRLLLIMLLTGLVTWFLFYLVINYNQRNRDNRIIYLSELKASLKDHNNHLLVEAQNSFNYGMLYNLVRRETDRIQAIYSLKNTKRLTDAYKKDLLSYTDDQNLIQEFDGLNELLSEFDRRIAESVNLDGKAAELLKANQPEGDTTSQFLFDPETVKLQESDAKDLEMLLNKIRTRLFNLDSLSTGLIDQEISTLMERKQFDWYVLFGAVFTLVFGIIVYFLNNHLKDLEHRFFDVLGSVAKGEKPDVDVEHKVEFASILKASRDIVGYMEDASHFAREIGDGHFDYEFEPKSEKDALGNSLIEMRDRLQEVAREDKIRNWINEGQARFGEILRQYNNDLDKLGEQIITNMVEYLGANQGALFVAKGEEGEEHLELLSAYAYKRKKFIEKRIDIGEGLAGQAYVEGKTIFLKDIKTDHYDIATGLGESKPTSLIIVPLKEEEKIEGIIEIASLHELLPHQIKFVETIGHSIASSLSSGKVNEEIRKLLEETQEREEEMKAQEEELRQNMEELAATQEQMERRNKELEEIQKKFDEERILLKAILQSDFDRIYFKDKSSKFIRVSRSMVELFGAKDESEIIGKSDFDFGFEAHAKKAYEDEQNIIRSGKPLRDIIEKEEWDDGHITWVSTTKNPLYDLDGNIIGTFGISRDITKSKQAELEKIKSRNWLTNYFRYKPEGYVVLDQEGNVQFVTQRILDNVGRKARPGLKFEDLFEEKTFGEFLIEIYFDSTRDREFEIELSPKGSHGKTIKFIAVTERMENEDRTVNIFLIEK